MLHHFNSQKMALGVKGLKFKTWAQEVRKSISDILSYELLRIFNIVGVDQHV